MNYDLTNKENRKRFIARCNSLLKNQRNNVVLIDESNRTLSQNRYIHVLCRILAQDVGVTEEYAKQVYFKELANPNLFVTCTKDPLTNEMVKITRSTCDLTIDEMRKAISRFITWAAENGYVLPEATLNDDGTMTFNDDENNASFHQAEIETSKEEWI
jgi:hypothetical protein